MVTLTLTAAERVRRLAREQQLPGATLRLATRLGGCTGSGYQYEIKLETRVGEGDLVFEASGARLVVDPNSYPLLVGSEVDYEETLMRSGFTIHNPNAVSSCACGRSFKVAGDAQDTTPFH